jgi:predicted nuclease with TOPRIM domain
MNYVEKLGYVKGLLNGLELKSSKEAKVIEASIELMDLMVGAISELSKTVESLTDNVDELIDELDDLSEEVADLSEEIDDINDELDSVYEDGDDDDDDFYEAECPNCEKMVFLQEVDLDSDKLICPHCKETLTIHCDDECDCEDD